MGAHSATPTSRTSSRLGGTALLLGASFAVAASLAPAAMALPGSTGSADGGTVTGGSAGNATSSNSNGGSGGEAGDGGNGGEGGDYTQKTSPSSSSSTGLLGLGGTSTTPTTGSRFANCTEARAAGRENIPRGDPDYAPQLDGDDSGIACENPPSSRY